MRESAIASHILLNAAQSNVLLWRNNSGMLYNEKGVPIRFGLGSFTPQMECKSSDYVGIQPVFITPDMVGTIVGVFVAIETKPSDWKFNSNDKHSLAQKKFIDMVIKAGGRAGFAASIKDFNRILHREY